MFDKIEELAGNINTKAKSIQDQVRSLEEALYKGLGIAWYNREPGFACWSHNEIQGYYDTPRDAYIALLERRNIDAKPKA